MESLDTNIIVESIWPWLDQSGEPNSQHSQYESGFYKDVRLILKNNWSVLNCKSWIELVDKEKLVKIDLTQFYEVCQYSQLNLQEMECIKDMRRKAQKCRSSLKSQAKMKTSNINLEKKVERLSDEKNLLEQEMFYLHDEIRYYKESLAIN